MVAPIRRDKAISLPDHARRIKSFGKGCIVANPIKITIKGSDRFGVDAPIVEDLLAQLQDFVAVLKGVEEAISDDSGAEIDWRVTDATKNSPLTFEVTPFPRRHAMNIDKRAAEVVTITADGIRLLESGAKPQLYFSNALLAKAQKLFERVANGLDTTLVDLSAYDNTPPLQIDKNHALEFVHNLQKLKQAQPIKYRELGSIEGTVTRVELDGYGRPIIWLRARIDGQDVKCVAKGHALDRIGHYQVSDVLNGLRVLVYGLLHYKDLEKIRDVEVEDLHVFGPDSDLPDYGDIIAPGFTGGLEAGEYLRQLREDE